MKICKIIIKEYQQFQDFELDLTYPEGHEKAGEPLEKVCLIGSNGTGKSTLLETIFRTLTDPYKAPSIAKSLIFKIQYGKKYFYLHNFKYRDFSGISIYKEDIDKKNDWQELLEQAILEQKSWIADNKARLPYVSQNNSNDLFIHSLAEGFKNEYKNFNDVPSATVNDALQLFKHFPYEHVISSDTLNDFWKLLIYQIKKRESDLLAFQKREENLDKTIRQVQEEFDKKSPKILNKIAELWDKILDKAGLEFDVEGASNPIQLNDNLQAYIRLKGTDKNIPYSQLSTGIRNFIFRVGHIFTLYFNRNIERGFLLLDEPENSLHPDFLYDLVDIYTGIIQNTQFFVATHNPIIAAQFEPYERFILEFDEQGAVHAKRGTTPVGDDPNDLLVQDFGVRNLLGKEGIKKWERYVELKSLIQQEENKANKVQLLEEFLSIGQAYNFPLQ
ncbi:MAG: Unknown protein [uncultured Aureispira sp.]|uniref:AAA+ ATPase domain-containing protein n=1 Tax=uncultured Aureispira sp. TaxID=1331704 RepID=A0A6S6UK88_9BACT|nr:MAG: Unknown protein [uncultured Aureispira sp.]